MQKSYVSKPGCIEEVKSSENGKTSVSLSDIDVIDSFEAANRIRWNRMDDDMSTDVNNTQYNLWFKYDGIEYHMRNIGKTFDSHFYFSEDVKNYFFNDNSSEFGFQIGLSCRKSVKYRNLIKYFGNINYQNFILLNMCTNLFYKYNLVFNPEILFFNSKRFKLCGLYKNKIVYSNNIKNYYKNIITRNTDQIIGVRVSNKNDDIINLKINEYFNKYITNKSDYHPSHKYILSDVRKYEFGTSSNSSYRIMSKIWDSDYIGGGGF